MLCDICQRPATGWCKTCNSYFCKDHGGDRCFRCSGAFMAVNPEVDPVVETAFYVVEEDSRDAGKGYLQCVTKPRMPTIYLDDPGPPECFECGGLAKQVCAHCQALFCPEHAGNKDICINCHRSSRIGIVILIVLFLVFGGLLLLGTLFSALG